MYQKLELIGNLGQDPEIVNFENGNQLCNLSIATTERWKDKTSNERKERTTWHAVKVNGVMATYCNQYLSKGDTVHVSGKIRKREYTNGDGQNIWITEVHAESVNFLKTKGKGTTQASNSQSATQQYHNNQQSGNGFMGYPDDEFEKA